MNNSERLEAVLQYSQMNPNNFAKALGRERAQGIYDVLKGKVGISKRLAKDIATKFPSFNEAWLLTGIGEKFTLTSNPESADNIINTNDRLREIRTLLNLTQEDMANIIGISRSTYTGIEKGNAPLTERNKKSIIDKLHINEVWLLTGVGEKITLTSNPESADNIINMGLKDRLIEFLRYKKITQHAFEISCGLSNGFVDKVGEGTRMSSLDRISEFYPELNIAWLRTGVGEMITTKLAVSENATKGVPYYENTEGTCGIVTQFNDYPESPTFYINYEHFNDCTAYIPVFGDSMFPQYCSGEIIAIKRIYNMDVIQWGEAYFVITNSNANSLKTVKQLHWCEDESKIILRASNPNYKGDTVINKVDIVSLFIIKGKIKRNQL